MEGIREVKALFDPHRGELRASLALGLFCLFCQACLSCQVPSSEVAGPSTRVIPRYTFEAAREVLSKAVDREDIAGAVGLIAVGGRVVFREAFGWKDIADDAPMREDTIFRIASMTKPITSVAVLMLHEEGSFQLDDPIARFIPEFEHPEIVVHATSSPRAFERVPASREITIRHLLTHTSGISYGFSGVQPFTRLYAEAEISDGLVQTEGTIGPGIRRLAKQPLLHEPGTAWKYGLSTDVLGRLVEVASGRTLAEFFEEDIFLPLGMKDSYFFLPEEKVSRLASVYRPRRGGGLRELLAGPIAEGAVVFSTSYHYQGPQTYFSGGAGLVSTVDDYYRFCQMLLNRGELTGVRLLKPETVREMTANQIGELSIGDGKYGFGVSVETADTAGAFGWGGFFFTSFWIDPELEVIGIFMAQLWPNQLARVDDDFRRAVDRAIR